LSDILLAKYNQRQSETPQNFSNTYIKVDPVVESGGQEFNNNESWNEYNYKAIYPDNSSVTENNLEPKSNRDSYLTQTPQSLYSTVGFFTYSHQQKTSQGANDDCGIQEETIYTETDKEFIRQIQDSKEEFGMLSVIEDDSIKMSGRGVVRFSLVDETKTNDFIEFLKRTALKTKTPFFSEVHREKNITIVGKLSNIIRSKNVLLRKFEEYILTWENLAELNTITNDNVTDNSQKERSFQ